MTTDQLGRAWTRTAADTMTCADGSILTIGADWTDAQAAQAVLGTVYTTALARLDAAVERLLHGTAHGLGYTDPEGGKHMDRAATYVTSKVFGPEAQALVDWRDAVWLHCFGVLQAVDADQRPIPTEDELLAELPVFVHPGA